MEGTHLSLFLIKLIIFSTNGERPLVKSCWRAKKLILSCSEVFFYLSSNKRTRDLLLYLIIPCLSHGIHEFILTHSSILIFSTFYLFFIFKYIILYLYVLDSILGLCILILPFNYFFCPIISVFSKFINILNTLLNHIIFNLILI